MKNTRIAVFEEHGSGEAKIRGIREHGRCMEIKSVFDIRENFPEFIDDPSAYITNDFTADVVLDFLKHPDLSEYLAKICAEKKIPVVASGKKHQGAITPFT